MRRFVLALCLLANPVLASDTVPENVDLTDFRGASIDPRLYPVLLDCIRDGYGGKAAECVEKFWGFGDCHLFAGDETEAISRCILIDAATWEAVLVQIEVEMQTRAADVDARGGDAGQAVNALARHNAANAAFRLWRRAKCEETEAPWIADYNTVTHEYASCMLQETAERAESLDVWGKP